MCETISLDLNGTLVRVAVGVIPGVVLARVWPMPSYIIGPCLVTGKA